MDQFTALRAFVRLVELETFTAVAADLHVKQSTISKWIAALEGDLGVRLVDRTTRSFRVTDSGRRFYDRARQVLADYEGAVAEVREGAATLRGRIRMSVPVVFGRRFVMPLVTGFLRQHGDLELELLFGDRYVSLVEEAYDLAIRVGVAVDSSLTLHALGDSSRRLVAAPSYLERRGIPRIPADLEQHQCLTHTQLSTRAGWSFRRGDAVHKVRVGGRVAANHSESTLYMARSGLGVALLASWLTSDALADGSLVQILPEYQPPRAPVRALTPPGRFVAPRVRALITHLRAGLAEPLAACE